MKGVPDLGVELEAVPTVAELVKNGLARATGQTSGKGTYTISDVGQQLIYDAMKRNAARAREAERVRLNDRHPPHEHAMIEDEWDGPNRPATTRCFYCGRLASELDTA